MTAENISLVLEDITIVTTEAAIDVFNAQRNYKCKQLFIEDVNKGTMISESYYNELLESSNDGIFMESASDTEISPGGDNKDADRCLDFRFDPIRHRHASGKLNRQLAELIVAAFEASQLAKREKGEANNPLGDLLKHRTRRMDDIIRKLYDGKVISIGTIVDFINRGKNSPSMLFEIVKIGGFGKVKNRKGEIQDNLMEVIISFRLPEIILTKKKYDLCIALDKIDEKCKEQAKARKAYGTRDDRFLDLVSEVGRMREDVLKKYDFNASNSDNCKNIRNKTCYTEKMEDKVLKKYEVGFHLLKNKDSKPEILTILNRIDSQRTSNDDYKFNSINNKPQIIMLARQFGMT